MSIETLKDSIPGLCQGRQTQPDVDGIGRDAGAAGQYGLFLACAIATPQSGRDRHDGRAATDKLTPAALAAAKAAASVMAMNNIYYRFVHLASNKEYATMPARLRMNVIGNPGVDKADFELWSLAVSAINGCGACIDAHEKDAARSGRAVGRRSRPRSASPPSFNRSPSRSRPAAFRKPPSERREMAQPNLNSTP